MEVAHGDDESVGVRPAATQLHDKFDERATLRRLTLSPDEACLTREAHFEQQIDLAVNEDHPRMVGIPDPGDWI